MNLKVCVLNLFHLFQFSLLVERHNFINSETLQNVGLLLKEWGSFAVDVPELKLLRQYHSDAVSWVSHFNDVLGRVQMQEDQNNAVDELKSIFEEGLSLKIQGIERCSFMMVMIFIFFEIHAFVYFLLFSLHCPKV